MFKHAHVGQTVLYYAPEGNAIGEDPVPAIITKVWSQECVNLELITGGFKGIEFGSINPGEPGVCEGPCWINVDGDHIENPVVPKTFAEAVHAGAFKPSQAAADDSALPNPSTVETFEIEIPCNVGTDE